MAQLFNLRQKKFENCSQRAISSVIEVYLVGLLSDKTPYHCTVYADALNKIVHRVQWQQQSKEKHKRKIQCIQKRISNI